MARLVAFDLHNQAVGEFTARCDRGWMVYGNAGVDGAGQTTITVPDDVAAKKWLQLGRMVLIERPPLPAWAGIIDTPWKATLPVELTLYNIEYLFALRSPEVATLLSGSVGSIIKQMISIMNAQEQLYLSIGKLTDAAASRDETLDQRTMWDQVIPLLERSGHEMILRPERDADNRLVLFADVGLQLGEDTGFLLDDSGPGKNMKVIDAWVNGKIINRVKGVSGQSTSESQLQSDVFEDQPSQDVYRTRSMILPFRDITQLTTLNEYTKLYLAASKGPYLDLTVDILDVDQTFANLRPGNRLIAHTSKVHLPGGITGWRGPVRILAMALNEESNTVRTKLRGSL